ncbi:hypothetical protein F5X96DRAFT_641931 [Biscogniauxia mediterranea]|nr:hypothetical protein F5X96DRAFT_641931 [Biscogniauxia mediterranea]
MVTISALLLVPACNGAIPPLGLLSKGGEKEKRGEDEGGMRRRKRKNKKKSRRRKKKRRKSRREDGGREQNKSFLVCQLVFFFSCPNPLQLEGNGRFKFKKGEGGGEGIIKPDEYLRIKVSKTWKVEKPSRGNY